MKDYWKKISFVQKAKLIFFGIVGLLVLIFALMNWKVIELSLIFGKVPVPVTILILISMFGGYAYARIYGWMQSKSLEREISYLKGELAATKEKLHKESAELKRMEDEGSKKD